MPSWFQPITGRGCEQGLTCRGHALTQMEPRQDDMGVEKSLDVEQDVQKPENHIYLGGKHIILKSVKCKFLERYTYTLNR